MKLSQFVGIFLLLLLFFCNTCIFFISGPLALTLKFFSINIHPVYNKDT